MESISIRINPWKVGSFTSTAQACSKWPCTLTLCFSRYLPIWGYPYQPGFFKRGKEVRYKRASSSEKPYRLYEAELPCSCVTGSFLTHLTKREDLCKLQRSSARIVDRTAPHTNQEKLFCRQWHAYCSPLGTFLKVKIPVATSLLWHKDSLESKVTY